jgi:hypothetical protein
MAAFHSIIYGRFWVITEEDIAVGRKSGLSEDQIFEIVV